MRRILLTIASFSLVACATVSKLTIEDRLRELGMSRAQADCVADELDERLDDGRLRDVARTLDDLTDDAGPRNVIDALGRVNDDRIARAAAQAGVSCLFVR
ncbi:hypothetical protein [Parvularcula marina]|uniref:Lipoprotein n=1 Tax=Parvularcula marina TaxID=2292771 RepID=A0A371RK67_9PROT|nr:hypothetical protein [Parvularcula marina]RFB05834.1 hypothetical protein DX908_11490 [Parvularcula marina]